MNKFTFLFLFIATIAAAQEQATVLDINLSNYAYPYTVGYYEFTRQQQPLKMAYMDVQPKVSNGKTVLLLHGKNFNGAYWKTTIRYLTDKGFRVIVPDQVGFGKSTKPARYQYSFQQLALNTKALLDHLKIEKVSVLGHSMGGMVATRFALLFPGSVEKLILENPIGLEDWKLVAPYSSIDQLYETEMKVTYESAKQYQLTNYYDGKWKPEYDEWVYLLTGWCKHKDYPLVAMNNALTSDMVFTQPVCYEFTNLTVPVLLIIGTRDRTAIGKQNVSKEVAATLGQYQLLGKLTKEKIKGSQLAELDQVGHLPHIEAFDRFIAPLIEFLSH